MQENIDQFALNDAAEVVAVESDKAETEENLSISDLKGLISQSGKKDFKLADAQNVVVSDGPDLAAKAAMVAQASQSNDVAFD